jgi:hypothetical protein
MQQPAWLNLLSLPHKAQASHKLHTMLQLQCMDHALNLTQHTTTVPRTFKEVMASNTQEQWLAAMQHEIDMLVLNNIFNLVLLPASQ